MSKNFPTGCESATALKYKRDHGIPSHIELRTSKQWKHIGYQVKKGSVCKYRFKAPLYSYGRTRSVEQSFFTQGQVEKIPKNAKIKAQKERQQQTGQRPGGKEND